MPSADPALNEAFRPSLHLVQQERKDLDPCSLAPKSRIFMTPPNHFHGFKNPMAIKIVVTIQRIEIHWHLGRHGREGWN